MAAKSATKKHAKQLPLMPGDAMSAAAEIDSNADRGVIDMAAFSDPDVARGVVQDGYSPPEIEHQDAEHLFEDMNEHKRKPEPAKEQPVHVRPEDRVAEDPAPRRQAKANMNLE